MEHFNTPGQLLNHLLKQRGWDKRTLAVVLGYSEQIISRLCFDKRSFDASLALKLEDVFGKDAQEFLRLQQSYDLAKAKIKEIPDPERAKRAALYGDLPISAMIKRGWIDASSVKDTQKVDEGLLHFFEVDDLSHIEILPYAARKTKTNMDTSPSQLVWLYRAKKMAEEMLVGTFNQKSLELVLTKLRSLLRAPSEISQVPRILLEAGIRFVVVEVLPGAKIDGACFWLNDRSPVVAISSRHNRIDNFWFVLRHELEHVRLSHGLDRYMLDVDLKGDEETIDEEERLANSAASNFCVPKKMMDAFIRKKDPIYSERDLRGFANTIKVHPGLIAGQLQYRTQNYTRFRAHLVPIRDYLLPTATSDGWGDVYPIGE